MELDYRVGARDHLSWELTAMHVPTCQEEVRCHLGHPMKLVRFFNNNMASAVQQTIEVSTLPSKRYLWTLESV